MYIFKFFIKRMYCIFGMVIKCVLFLVKIVFLMCFYILIKFFLNFNNLNVLVF